VLLFVLKAKSAVRVPPNAILLPGSKSIQKCLLLAQRQAFFCFVFFVATKKMTLLSGNPDGFALS
jgi:hypothetical protein